MAETVDVEHLVDLSGYNPVSNWREVRENGIVGASIKVSQQVNYLNPLCGAQVAGARSVGIAPGGYHFGDPRVNAARQAEFFVNNAQAFNLFADDTLAPMYDAENWEGGGLVWPSPQVLNSHITEHIRVTRELTGVRRHLVYGSLSWWQDGWLDPDVWADEDVLLWIAVYNGRPGDLQGWDHPNDALHQHTSDGIVTGIPGRVDKNVTTRGRKLDGLKSKGVPEMQLYDKMLNAWDGEVTVEQVLRAVDFRSASADERAERIEATQAAHTATLAAIAEDRDVTPEFLKQVIGDAVRENASTGNVDVEHLAELLAAKMPAQPTQQDLVNALLSVQGTVLYRQRPTGG